jgi:hypothetical protein
VLELLDEPSSERGGVVELEDVVVAELALAERVL